MRLTTKGRYAVTAMIDLAIHDNSGPVTLTDIATSQHISLSYLEQLFAQLRKAGLVRGLRGPGGGYRLAKDVNKISMADIISAVDETVDATRCKGAEDCQDGERCLTHELWADLSKQLYEFLDGIYLGDITTRPGVQATAMKQDAQNGRTNALTPRSL